MTPLGSANILHLLSVVYLVRDPGLVVDKLVCSGSNSSTRLT